MFHKSRLPASRRSHHGRTYGHDCWKNSSIQSPTPSVACVSAPNRRLFTRAQSPPLIAYLAAIQEWQLGV